MSRGSFDPYQSKGKFADLHARREAGLTPTAPARFKAATIAACKSENPVNIVGI
jgi:hypothetical protein